LTCAVLAESWGDFWQDLAAFTAIATSILFIVYVGVAFG
jgi:hypothetical protein